MKGRLFVFEGADGVGKTSIIDFLYSELTKQNISVRKIGFPGYEKGTLGNLVKNLHDHPLYFDINSIDPVSLQLLHVAAHIDSINRDIIPALGTDTIVLLDRYWWSTYIYGKYSGIKELVLIKMIEIEKHYWSMVIPDRLFHVIREEAPLKENIDIQVWKCLQEEYQKLSNIETINYPVFEVVNESTLKIAAGIVLNEIMEIIK
jgi:thymidylate kinase